MQTQLDEVGREVERRKKLDATGADFKKVEENNQKLKLQIEELKAKKE